MKLQKKPNYFLLDVDGVLNTGQFIYNSKGKFGKGDTVISPVKDYKLMDEETGEMLDVKLKCSKKIDDAIDGFTPEEGKKVFKQCLDVLVKRGLVKE